MEANEIFESRIDFSELHETINEIRKEVGKVIIGQRKLIHLLIAGILADGHVLLEGVPGVAKTLTAKILAKVISADFSRIQFTPDLMPSDILGTSVFNIKNSEFDLKKGPIFSNIILIDEINRAPAKTQSALFEVMEERQITIDGFTYKMEAPFMVLATQNPIEQEGTYRLPEAQLDRFIFKLEVGYPDQNEEVEILKGHHQRQNNLNIDEIKPLLSKEKIKEYRNKISGIHIDDKLLSYIATIVQATRNHPSIYLGASPRASLSLLNGSKALAALKGRDFITPEDIKELTIPVIKHRIILSPEKEMEGVTPEDVIKEIVEKTEVPR
jgi:MoxR-like ATPase